jgi:hypothetical protein
MTSHGYRVNAANCWRECGKGLMHGNFDATGAYRVKEAGLDIHPSGTMQDGVILSASPPGKERRRVNETNAISRRTVLRGIGCAMSLPWLEAMGPVTNWSLGAPTARPAPNRMAFVYVPNGKNMPEGDGTLLDHCMIAYGCGVSDGNTHTHDNLPILLAGCGCGTLKPGRHLRFPAESETPLTNLWVSMLDRVKAGVDILGDSTGRLPGLIG